MWGINGWDKLTNARDNMIRKDNEKNLSLSAASLTEVGYRGELGIDGPEWKIKWNAILDFECYVFDLWQTHLPPNHRLLRSLTAFSASSSFLNFTYTFPTWFERRLDIVSIFSYSVTRWSPKLSHTFISSTFNINWIFTCKLFWWFPLPVHTCPRTQQRHPQRSCHNAPRKKQIQLMKHKYIS